jgi:integrase
VAKFGQTRVTGGEGQGILSKLVKLTARNVETGAPGAEIRDTEVRGLRLRVSPKGLRTFVLVTRYPGQKHASRRALTATSLKAAREEAEKWKGLVRRGVDPHEEEARQAHEAILKSKNTFVAVAGAYIADIHRRKQRKAAIVEREIRQELVGKWADLLITDITRRQVVSLIEAIRDRPAPYYAHNIFGHCRSLFAWAINSDVYGLEASPCDRIKPAQLIAAKKPRQRVLSDDEIRAFWRATGKLGYPLGPLFRMLLLTGQRKSEVAEAPWPEFDLVANLWTVPPERFKSDSAHIVPLTDDAIRLLQSLPQFKGGDFLFSSVHGTAPVNGFSKAKQRLDTLMLEELREGDAKATLPPFVIHDLRRTLRTRLSGLRIPEPVAEMVIGHGRKGLQRVYDQHKFIDEMREALEAWNARLRAIVEPPPANVVALAERGVA